MAFGALAFGATLAVLTGWHTTGSSSSELDSESDARLDSSDSEDESPAVGGGGAVLAITTVDGARRKIA